MNVAPIRKKPVPPPGKAKGPNFPLSPELKAVKRRYESLPRGVRSCVVEDFSAHYNGMSARTFFGYLSGFRSCGAGFTEWLGSLLSTKYYV